jgi:hypothetical protein
MSSFNNDKECIYDILIMGVRLTSHWTAAAFTGLLSIPG